MTAIEDYYAALERLKTNAPLRLPKGTVINKDSVALEAGRKRSSIKKSRPVFDQLIKDIELSAKQQSSSHENEKALIERLKSEKKHYRSLYHESLNRELLLSKRVWELESLLKMNTSSKNTRT